MKKLIVAIATSSLLLSTPVSARDREYRNRDEYRSSHQDRDHHRSRRDNGDRWVVPLVGGIILGAVISRSTNREVVVPPQDVYVYQTPPTITCWETRRVDYYGNVYYTRECR